MLTCLVRHCKSFPWVRITSVVVLTVLLAGWTTCTAIVNFSCPGTMPQPRVTSLLPDIIPGNAESVLIVDGSGFVPESQILWNGSALQTRFVDSLHLQATITEQTLASLGGSAGSSGQISVRSQDPAPVVGCPSGGNSATLVLVIN